MRQLKFDPNTYSIIVDAKIKSKPAIIIKLILDTGSSVVVLPWKLVPLIGLKVDLKKVIKTTTATTVETVPQVLIPEMSILGSTVRNVEGIIKDLPPQAAADGPPRPVFF